MKKVKFLLSISFFLKEKVKFKISKENEKIQLLFSFVSKGNWISQTTSLPELLILI